MIRVFLDTNVLVDYLAHRSGFFEDSALIVSLAINNKVKLYVASMSFATASYLMAKHYRNDSAAIKLSISNFIRYCNVTVVDRSTIESSVASAFDDFEDGMQHACAMSCKADYIVTRNVSDFEGAVIPVLAPHDFLEALIAPPATDNACHHPAAPA